MRLVTLSRNTSSQFTFDTNFVNVILFNNTNKYNYNFYYKNKINKFSYYSFLSKLLNYRGNNIRPIDYCISNSYRINIHRIRNRRHATRIT